MNANIFWTGKRLEAVSRTLLTLFQAFVIAGTLGGVLWRISSPWLQALFIVLTLALFSIGVVLSDWPLRRGA